MVKIRLKEILESSSTVVLYESPHRILKLLEEVKSLGAADRQVSVSREISKHFEETVRGTAEELQQHFTTKAPKGEFVVCIAGQDGEVKSEKAEGKRISKENRLRP